MPDDQAQRIGRWLLGVATVVLIVATRHRPPGPAVSELGLRGVRYRYAGATAWALDGLDLELEAGEVLGVTGANDAGKTTLCLVGGRPRPRRRSVASSRARSGSAATIRASCLRSRACRALRDPVPERGHPAVGHSRDGLGRGRLRAAQPGPRCRRRSSSGSAGRWSSPGSATWPSARPDRLSGGQAQLVALAGVLALRPASLILDEPTSQLDPAGTILVGDALARLGRETGTALLIVEHKTDLLARIADRVAVVAAGRVAILGAADKVLADPRLPSLGVDPPAAVRLGRLAREAGVGAAFAKGLADTSGPAEGRVAGPATP